VAEVEPRSVRKIKSILAERIVVPRPGQMCGASPRPPKPVALVNGPRRVFQHVRDAGLIAPDGVCAACGSVVPPADLLILPGPGYDGEGDDVVSKTLTTAHRLLEPIRVH